MQLFDLSDEERRAFAAFCHELTFKGKVQLTQGERIALERCWLAAHEYLVPAVVVVRS